MSSNIISFIKKVTFFIRYFEGTGACPLPLSDEDAVELETAESVDPSEVRGEDEDEDEEDGDEPGEGDGGPLDESNNPFDGKFFNTCSAIIRTL